MVQSEQLCGSLPMHSRKLKQFRRWIEVEGRSFEESDTWGGFPTIFENQGVCITSFRLI